jgi:hypothetical protein
MAACTKAQREIRYALAEKPFFEGSGALRKFSIDLPSDAAGIFPLAP